VVETEIKSNTFFISRAQSCKGENAKSPPVMSKQYGYRWIDLDEYYHSVNGLNSIGGTPEDLQVKDG
jgi:hypothetical protein